MIMKIQIRTTVILLRHFVEDMALVACLRLQYYLVIEAVITAIVFRNKPQPVNYIKKCIWEVLMYGKHDTTWQSQVNLITDLIIKGRDSIKTRIK